MRGELLSRVVAHRYLFDHDAGQLERAGGDRGDLGQRGIPHQDDRPVDRVAAMALHDVPQRLLVNVRHVSQQPEREVEILSLLADERNVEGIAVLDEDLSVTVEDHAARRAQLKRSLAVALRHLLERRVLRHLEEPEAHGQRGEHDGDPHPNDGEAKRHALTIVRKPNHDLLRPDLPPTPPAPARSAPPPQPAAQHPRPLNPAALEHAGAELD